MFFCFSVSRHVAYLATSLALAQEVGLQESHHKHARREQQEGDMHIWLPMPFKLKLGVLEKMQNVEMKGRKTGAKRLSENVESSVA